MNHILIQQVLNISTMKLINVLYTLNTVVVEALYMSGNKNKKVVSVENDYDFYNFLKLKFIITLMLIYFMLTLVLWVLMVYLF